MTTPKPTARPWRHGRRDTIFYEIVDAEGTVVMEDFSYYGTVPDRDQALLALRAVATFDKAREALRELTTAWSYEAVLQARRVLAEMDAAGEARGDGEGGE